MSDLFFVRWVTNIKVYKRFADRVINHQIQGAIIMNTQSIYSLPSPFQLLTRKFNQIDRVRSSENPDTDCSRCASKQPGLTRNPQHIIENQLARGIEKVNGGDRISAQDDLPKLESDEQASSTHVSQLQGFSAQISQSADIEVVTKEGDIIKIRLAQSVSNSQTALKIEQGTITASGMQNNFVSSTDFSVSVEGNLNEDEQKSLKELLKQMDKIGRDFFNGHIQAAFDHAQKIGLDSRQIASFSMSLSMEKSIQAVTAYQQAVFPDRQIEPEKIMQAVDFFSQARGLLKTAQSALEPFESQLSVFSALFNAVNQVGRDTNNEQTPTEATPLWQQIIKPLGQTLLEADKLVQS